MGLSTARRTRLDLPGQRRDTLANSDQERTIHVTVAAMAPGGDQFGQYPRLLSRRARLRDVAIAVFLVVGVYAGRMLVGAGLFQFDGVKVL